ARHLEHKTACNWIVGPVSQPADLAQHVRADGFSCRIHCFGMACEMDGLGLAPATPKGIRIELVDTPLPLTPLSAERRRRRHQGRTAIARFQPRETWHFSARLNGTPVGETTLYNGQSAAGIYDVEVVEKCRCRGIGSALIDAALRHAKQLG